MGFRSVQRSLQLSDLKGLQQGLTSLAVQRLRLQASTAWGTGSNPGQETKIPYATWPGQKKSKNLKKKKKGNLQIVEMEKMRKYYILAGEL